MTKEAVKEMVVTKSMSSLPAKRSMESLSKLARPQ